MQITFIRHMCGCVQFRVEGHEPSTFSECRDRGDHEKLYGCWTVMGKEETWKFLLGVSDVLDRAASLAGASGRMARSTRIGGK
jgi:hypothetical protein